MTPFSQRRRNIAAPILVLLAAVAPFLPTLRAPFIYDDTTIIRDNVLLRGWSALWHVWSLPYWPPDGADRLGLYRPLQIALLAGVWNATGGAALWFHVYAIALSALTAVSVWWLLRRATGGTAALIAAVWFAAHPLHVEAIASVANSSELIVVLCTIGLVGILAGTEPSPQDVGRGWLRAAAVGGLAAAALLAKESGLLALPVAALTAWGWRRPAEPSPSGAEFIRSNLRVWAASGCCLTAALLARIVVLGAPIARTSIAAQGLGEISGSERVAAMLSLWPRIVGMLTWPTSLAPYYGPSMFPSPRLGLALMAIIVVAAIVALAINLARQGDRRPLVALGWIALTYVPASNLLTATGQILSDRTLMGATVGVALGIAWAIDRSAPWARRVAIGLSMLAIARSVIVATNYSVAWTSHRALWTRLVDTYPEEHLGYKLLGMDARARGDTTRALALLTRAMTMAPADRQIRFEYAQLLYGTGRYAASVRVMAPLLRDRDARSERAVVGLYLDAVGRAAGPDAVVRAAAPLLHTEAGPTAALFAGVAQEALHNPLAADSIYALGLRRDPADTLLTARRAMLAARQRRGPP